jgi:predicted enzyme related to lactoylglutathione lyase
MHPHFTILYVSDVAKSSAFYAKYLERPIAESSPGFAVIPLSESSLLGLWKRDNVKPEVNADAASGAMELAVPVDSDALVDSTFAKWQAQGVRMVQAPIKMDFGYTFTALDDDGHRLRVWHPSMP